MTARRAFCVMLALCWLALAGCDSGEGVGAAPSQTRLRVVNLVPNAAFLTLTLDNDSPVVTGLGFQQLTGYIQVTAGTREFKVSVDSSQTFIIDISATIIAGTDNTFVVAGPVEDAIGNLILDTQLLTPNGGTFAVRALNTVAGSPPLDIYFTAPGIDLNATAPALTNVTFGQAISVFASVNTGSYEIRATPTGTKEVIYDTGVVAFGDKTFVEAIIYGTGSARLVDVAMLNIDSDGTGQVLPSLLAEFKLLNAASVGPLNVFVDGNLILSNVPFAGVSNYQITTAGSHTIEVQAASTPGATQLAIPVNLGAASDTSIAVSGAEGALQGLVLNDNNLPPGFGHARIRFVNASPAFPAVDAYINFVKQFTNIVSNSASPSTEITADFTGTTVYEFDFNLAGTTTPVVQLPGVVVIAG